jgi:hypothetical protein
MTSKTVIFYMYKYNEFNINILYNIEDFIDFEIPIQKNFMQDGLNLKYMQITNWFNKLM